MLVLCFGLCFGFASAVAGKFAFWQGGKIHDRGKRSRGKMGKVIINFEKIRGGALIHGGLFGLTEDRRVVGLVMGYFQRSRVRRKASARWEAVA